MCISNAETRRKMCRPVVLNGEIIDEKFQWRKCKYLRNLPTDCETLRINVYVKSNKTDTKLFIKGFPANFMEL